LICVKFVYLQFYVSCMVSYSIMLLGVMFGNPFEISWILRNFGINKSQVVIFCKLGI